AFLRGQPARGTARVLDDVLTTSRFSGGGAGGVVGALFASRAVAAFAGVGGSVGGEAGGGGVRAVGLEACGLVVDVPAAFALPHGRGDGRLAVGGVGGAGLDAHGGAWRDAEQDDQQPLGFEAEGGVAQRGVADHHEALVGGGRLAAVGAQLAALMGEVASLGVARLAFDQVAGGGELAEGAAHGVAAVAGEALHVRPVDRPVAGEAAQQAA